MKKRVRFESEEEKDSIFISEDDDDDDLLYEEKKQEQEVVEEENKEEEKEEEEEPEEKTDTWLNRYMDGPAPEYPEVQYDYFQFQVIDQSPTKKNLDSYFSLLKH